jgi:hypothetical protein
MLENDGMSDVQQIDCLWKMDHPSQNFLIKWSAAQVSFSSTLIMSYCVPLWLHLWSPLKLHIEHWADFCSVVGGCLITKRIFSCMNCGNASSCKAFVCQNARVSFFFPIIPSKYPPSIMKKKLNKSKICQVLYAW